MTRSAAHEEVAAAFEWMPEYGETFGPEVAEVAEMAGFGPDPEQRLALNMLFATNAGKVAVRDFGIVCPRQNMKTGLLKQAALGWLYVTEQRLIVWSAHEFGTSQEAFRDMCVLIESTPDLDREVKQIHRGNGDEAIELEGDRRLKFKARTKGGGRGLTGDKIVLDEAMFLRPSHMGALVPTLRAVEDPQLVFAGSAGLVESEVWRSVRDRGRGGGDASLGYLEYCDPVPGGCATEDCDHRVGIPGCALDDPARVRRANPALGRRITMESLLSDRRTLPPDEYARETLGWWDDPGQVENGMTVEDWNALGPQKDEELPSPSGLLVLGIDVAPGHAAASIVVVGGGVLEMIERRPSASWLPARVAELVTKHKAIAVAYDPAGPIGSLIPEFAKAGVELTPVEGKDSTRAVGALVAGVSEKSFRHRGEDEFKAAVAGARRRQVGDGHKWSRKDSTVDITPLVAATVALWVAGEAPPEVITPGVWFV